MCVCGSGIRCALSHWSLRWHSRHTGNLHLQTNGNWLHTLHFAGGVLPRAKHSPLTSTSNKHLCMVPESGACTRWQAQHAPKQRTSKICMNDNRQLPSWHWERRAGSEERKGGAGRRAASGVPLDWDVCGCGWPALFFVPPDTPEEILAIRSYTHSKNVFSSSCRDWCGIGAGARLQSRCWHNLEQ